MDSDPGGIFAAVRALTQSEPFSETQNMNIGYSGRY